MNEPFEIKIGGDPEQPLLHADDDCIFVMGIDMVYEIAEILIGDDADKDGSPVTENKVTGWFEK